MFTLDTNILISYAHGDLKIANFFFSELEKDTSFFLPTIVVIEFLAFPVLNNEERSFLSSLLPQLDIIPLDLGIAFLAGDLRRMYKVKLGDSAIAATAITTHSTLITRNLRDFKKITELKILTL